MHSPLRNGACTISMYYMPNSKTGGFLRDKKYTYIAFFIRNSKKCKKK